MRLICVACRCEVERVEIAHGRVVAVCAACEAYGDAAELVAGVSLKPAEPLPRLRVIEGLGRSTPAEPVRRSVSRRVASGIR